MEIIGKNSGTNERAVHSVFERVPLRITPRFVPEVGLSSRALTVAQIHRSSQKYSAKSTFKQYRKFKKPGRLDYTSNWTPKLDLEKCVL